MAPRLGVIKEKKLIIHLQPRCDFFRFIPPSLKAKFEFNIHIKVDKVVKLGATFSP